jgi:protoheme IX farnesyltransferase
MAIAWLYREDYARAGMKMLPALPGTAGMAGRQALAHALVLIPVSLLPGVWGQAGVVYSLGALALGLAYAGAALRFALAEDAARARTLLLVSLVYLPFLHALVLLDPMVRAAIEQST